MIEQDLNTLFLQEKQDDDGNIIVTDKLKSYFEIIEIINSKHHLAFPTTYPHTKHNQFLRYDEDRGVYLNSYIAMEQMLKESLGSKWTESTVNNIFRLLARSNMISMDEFDTDKNIINCLNGLIDIIQNKIYNHTPEHKSLIQIPVYYDPGAECPNIDTFFNEIVNPEYVPALYEICGYCLYRGLPIQQAILLISPGQTGKGTFLQLLSHFLGFTNTTALSLNDLGSDFGISNLRYSLANICGDLPLNTMLPDDGIFKKATGGDPLEAKIKYGDNVTFVNTAKMIFSSNGVPPTKDHSDGYYRRWLIIDFPNKFTDNAQNQDVLIKNLTSNNELSGLLNKSLEGLIRLLSNGKFTNSVSPTEAAEIYDNESKSFYNWYNDHISIDKEYYEYVDNYNGALPNAMGPSTLSTDYMYSHYLSFCVNTHIATPYSKIAFSRALSHTFKDSLHVKSINNVVDPDSGTKKRGYLNVLLTELV